MPLLTINNLIVRIDERPVVNGLSLRLNAGEVLALAGESGSGKSLTAASIVGLLPKTAQASGEILYDSQPLLHQPDSLLNRLRGHEIAMVFQNSLSTLDPAWRIGQQLQQNLKRLQPALSGKALRAAALDWLARMSIRQPERVYHLYPHELSGGMRQRVLIALAAMCRPRLLIADEPTTALDASVQREMLELLRELCTAEQMAMLIVTHDFGVVSSIAHRVAVMRQGEIVETGTTADMLQHPSHPYTRALLAAVPRPNLQPVVEEAAAPLLTANAVSRYYWRHAGGWWPKKTRFSALEAVSVTLNAGETLGIIGESGSGKSTLLRLLAQLLTPDSGDVTLHHDQPFRRTVQSVFQDSLSSFNPRLRLREQLIRAQLRVASVADRAQALREAQRVFSEVGLDAALLNRYPHQLSGGQRQRANIARALVVNPQVLLLDEPTSALDLTVQAQVIQLLDRLQQQRHLACLFVSHNLALVSQFCQRIVVMENGRVVDEFPRHALFSPQRHPVTQRLLSASLLPDTHLLTPERIDDEYPLSQENAAV